MADIAKRLVVPERVGHGPKVPHDVKREKEK